MVTYMDRLIGSAQRLICIENPDLRSLPGCLKLTFHIQGFDLQMADQLLLFRYTNMVEQGLKLKKSVKLRFMDRLLRRPANIGEVFEDEDNIIHATFWTEPELNLKFDLKPKGQVELWSEVYIMIRSSGFDLRRPEPTT